MTPVTTPRRALRRSDSRRRPATTRPAASTPTLFDAAPGPAPGRAALEAPAEPAALAGSGETLDRLVVGSWERLATRADTPCLLCGGAMEATYGAHAIPIGGRCRDCGTMLS